MESPAKERVHRRAKERAVSDRIVRRANRKAPDSWLHRRSQDKEATLKALSHSTLHRRKAEKVPRRGKSP